MTDWDEICAQAHKRVLSGEFCREDEALVWAHKQVSRLQEIGRLISIHETRAEYLPDDYRVIEIDYIEHLL